LVLLCAVIAIGCERQDEREPPPTPTPPAKHYGIGPYAVAELRPAGWLLQGYGSDLVFRVAGGRSPYSDFKVHTACQGRCEEAKLLDQLRQSAEQLSKSFERDDAKEGCVTTWTRKFGEIRPRVLSNRIDRSGAGRCRETIIEVNYLEAGQDVALGCSARLFGDDVRFADALLDECLRLRYRVGEGDDPLERLFARQFDMLGERVMLPPIDGWKFASWLDNNGFVTAEVRLESKGRFSDLSVVKHACKGTCDEEIAIARDRRGKRDTPLASLGDGLWLERYDANHGRVEVFAAATSKTKRGTAMTCTASLVREDAGQAAAVETFCKAVFARWR
jgi:hypothetical protein